MDKPSQDVIDLGRAGRDIRHSLSRHSGVASWRQSGCRMASQDMLVTCGGRCKKEPGQARLFFLPEQAVVASASG